MSLKLKIREFLSGLKNEHKLFPYLYNKTDDHFDAQNDWVYYSGPVWDEEESIAAIETFIAGKWLPSGEKVAAFESQFSYKFGFKSSVMVNSGSSANLVMITALKKHLNWNDGDEVIVSCVGFPTTIAPLIQNNLVPAFIDITMDDLNFDLNLIESKINSKTRAIFISPVLGNPPDMDRIDQIAKKHNLSVILDGCDSLGSKWKGKDLSHYALATSCSFYPAHHITTGEGGMVSANDPKLITLARSIAWWGRDCYCVGSSNLLKDGSCRRRFSNWLEGFEGQIDHKYLFTNIGYNLKPLDLQGAIGLEQLKKVDQLHHLRRENKVKIQKLFEKHVPGIRIPNDPQNAETGWFGVPIICQNLEQKTKLVNLLEGNRIQTRNYFAGNILLHPGYKHLDQAADYPEANRVLREVFFVGCHPKYGDKTLEYFDHVLSQYKQL